MLVPLAEVFQIVAQLTIGVAVPALILSWDTKRLTPQELERSWNDASRWSAVVAFGPLSLIVHAVKTRRSLMGLFMGLDWALIAVALSIAVGAGT